MVISIDRRWTFVCFRSVASCRTSGRVTGKCLSSRATCSRLSRKTLPAHFPSAAITLRYLSGRQWIARYLLGRQLFADPRLNALIACERPVGDSVGNRIDMVIIVRCDKGRTVQTKCEFVRLLRVVATHPSEIDRADYQSKVTQ